MSGAEHRGFQEHAISPISFLTNASSRSGPASPNRDSPFNSSNSNSLDNRGGLHDGWEGVGGIIVDPFEPLNSSTEMGHFDNVPDDGPSSSWSNDRSNRDRWIQGESRRAAAMLLECPSPSPGTTRLTEGGDSTSFIAAANSFESDLGDAVAGGTRSPLATRSEDLNVSFVNDENGERTPDGERMEEDDEDNNDSDSTVSSVHTDQFDSEAEAQPSEDGTITPPMRDRQTSESLGRPDPSDEAIPESELRAAYNTSPSFTSVGVPLRPFFRRVTPGSLKTRLEINERENRSGSNNISRNSALRRRKDSANKEGPMPLVMPSKTRLKITVNRWNVAAIWKWTAGDETCGICRMPFEACCIECKTPGDECPLALGSCKHSFHMHCIVKWTETQNTPRPQCPLCRQEWKFAAL